MSEHPVQVAKALQQLEGRFLAHAFDPGDVVGAVPHQREEVHDPVRVNAEPVARVGFVHPLLLDGGGPATARVEERHAGTDQLIKVLVSRNDHDLETAVRRCCSQRADDVVRLVAVHAEHRHPERPENLFDPLHRAIEVLLQLLVELGARRLVLGVALLAERYAHVVHPPEIVRVVLREEADEEVRDAPSGRRVLAPARGERARDHGEEGPVDERVAVDQEQRGARRGGHGRKIIDP